MQRVLGKGIGEKHRASIMTTVSALRRAYIRARDNNADTFTLDGNEFVTGYAKYLLQYFEMQNLPEDQDMKFTPYGWKT